MVTPIVVSSVKSKGKVIVFGDMNTHARMLQHEVLSFNDANSHEKYIEKSYWKTCKSYIGNLDSHELVWLIKCKKNFVMIFFHTYALFNIEDVCMNKAKDFGNSQCRGSSRYQNCSNG